MWRCHLFSPLKPFIEEERIFSDFIMRIFSKFSFCSQELFLALFSSFALKRESLLTKRDQENYSAAVKTQDKFGFKGIAFSALNLWLQAQFILAGMYFEDKGVEY